MSTTPEGVPQPQHNTFEHALAELKSAMRDTTGASKDGYRHHVHRSAMAWASLTVSQRAQIIQENPYLIGNIEGVPIADRYRANALAMSRDLRASTTQQSAPSWWWRRKWQTLQPTDQTTGEINVELLSKLRDEVGVDGTPAGTADEPFAGLQILAYRRAQGRGDRGAIVEVFGDLTTADTVVVDVPGMRNFPQTFTSGLRRNTLAVHKAIRNDARDESETNPHTQIRSVATVSWLGYHTPSGIGATSRRLAMAGASRLAAFLTGLGEQIRPEAHLMVNSHSYGTLTTNCAFKELATDPDRARPLDLVKFTGSPGIGPDGTTYVPQQTVIVASSRDHDGVAQSGAHGPRPHVPGNLPRVLAVPDPTDHRKRSLVETWARIMPGLSDALSLRDHVHYGADAGSLHVTSLAARGKLAELTALGTGSGQVARRLYSERSTGARPPRWVVGVGTAYRKTEAAVLAPFRHLPIHRRVDPGAARTSWLPASAAGNVARAEARLEALIRAHGATPSTGGAAPAPLPATPPNPAPPVVHAPAATHDPAATHSPTATHDPVDAARPGPAAAAGPAPTPQFLAALTFSPQHKIAPGADAGTGPGPGAQPTRPRTGPAKPGRPPGTSR